MAVLSVAKLSVTGYGHSPEQPVAKIFVVFCNGPITRQNGFEVYPDPCMCPSPESMFGDGHKRYRSSSHSGLCTGASARILLLQRASSYCRSLRLSWEMSQSQDGMAMCGHVWPVWGRADPPTKTLSHVSRVLAVHRQYHLHHLYLALTMPNLLMNLDPMLTSCAVKKHDPLDYILLPLPKMSSFMIGVTALLWPGRWNGCKLLRRQASAWRRRTWR